MNKEKGARAAAQRDTKWERPRGERCASFARPPVRKPYQLSFDFRAKEQATPARDAPFFDDMIVKGHRPLLVMLVEIEQIFFHCMKSFMRARLWEPESWHPEAVPPHAVIAKSVQPREETLEELERYYGPQYETHLYG